ncbi:SGNH/GDSL hydrolase family protein [Tardiphaga robiniae]|uniref:GDSL family lipase n=1 Tax=Tardiphaga robiniae TaxID=943830 RepID=A0A163XEN4_9BRAD|nr:SGNH/GDSL hydrolase family protein [Tardiphaga robiniae]KZD20815.1 GDSL family lipase [Tardiphaga robiniae]
MSFVGHLSRLAVVAAFAASTTLAFPISSSVAYAEAAQAAPADSKGADQSVAVNDPADAAKRGVAAKAIDKVKEVAKTATDILSRVPCRTPKGGMKAMGALPHVASKLVAGKPVVIVAFGSSSTEGYGSTAPEFTYPNRLAAQLHRAYPSANITVLNRGKGGEDAPEMMARLQSEVINSKPDLVIWQVGTNAVLRNLDPGETSKMVEDGVARIQAAGADLVLVDPQYSPLVNTRPEGTSKMVSLLHKVAELRKVGIFPRFEVMKEWHEGQQMSFDSFVIADGLHMNDWGYACFAQLLGDNIIKSVGQVKLGINEPQIQQAQKPL